MTSIGINRAPREPGYINLVTNSSGDLVGPCFVGTSLDNLATVSDNFCLVEAHWTFSSVRPVLPTLPTVITVVSSIVTKLKELDLARILRLVTACGPVRTDSYVGYNAYSG